MQRKSIRIVMLAAAAAILYGCAEEPLPTSAVAARQANEILSRTYAMQFTLDAEKHTLISEDGLPLQAFLGNLATDPPGLIELRPAGPEIDARELMETLEKSGIYRLSEIAILPVDTSQKTTPGLRLEATFYLYKLAVCRDYLDQRKLDHVALSSPGFGCAVERNLMLSLARPSDWRQGRRLAPPSAQSDAKAVSTLYEMPPTPFPAAGQ
ncbi:MAG: hypothetical protein K9G33_08830 [Sneathiella sp.]|nr:hypothetical protein [Sneathiella sp.]